MTIERMIKEQRDLVRQELERKRAEHEARRIIRETTNVEAKFLKKVESERKARYKDRYQTIPVESGVLPMMQRMHDEVFKPTVGKVVLLREFHPSGSGELTLAWGNKFRVVKGSIKPNLFAQELNYSFFSVMIELDSGDHAFNFNGGPVTVTHDDWRRDRSLIESALGQCYHDPRRVYENFRPIDYSKIPRGPGPDPGNCCCS